MIGYEIGRLYVYFFQKEQEFSFLNEHNLDDFIVRRVNLFIKEKTLLRVDLARRANSDETGIGLNALNYKSTWISCVLGA